MRVAFSIWKDRVSPLFDSAAHLLLVEPNSRGLQEKSLVNVDSLSMLQRIQMLKKWNLDLFVCGGITPSVLKAVRNQSIETVPFMCGRVDDLIQALERGEDLRAMFSMPGYKEEA